MELSPEICERARLTRDARFDGRFFIGVTSTGVYCRPVCPVQPPQPKNVRFFPSAAAAAEAGFRPCLRCRPESSPGTPAWNGTTSTVARALRLIAEGALDQGSVDRLATVLGVSSRHLRRLFFEHLGATPIAVAQTRRLHFAKKLLDETVLPMTEVALSAGFGSIRRFNATFQSTFGRNPRTLRRAALPAQALGSGSVSLQLGFRPPYAWEVLIDFLAARATPGVEQVDGSSYRRTIAFDRQQGLLEVRRGKAANCLELRVLFPDPRALVSIVERVRRIFDLGADPIEIENHLRRDPQLARRIAAQPGLRVPGAWDGFELTVRAILGQQVTVQAASTLAGRLAQAFGQPLGDSGEDGLHLLFPTPDALAQADIARIGLPGKRAEAIRRLAEAVARGRIAFDASVAPEQLQRQLAELPGIGDWTAQYVAMRALGEPDAFPASDLGLLRAASGTGRKITPAQLLEQAEAWRPWRAYAAMHLWNDLSTPLRNRSKGRRRKVDRRGDTR